VKMTQEVIKLRDMMAKLMEVSLELTAALSPHRT